MTRHQSKSPLELPEQSSHQPLQLHILGFVHLQGQPRLRVSQDTSQSLIRVFDILSSFQDRSNFISPEDSCHDGNEFYLRHLLSRAHPRAPRPRNKLATRHRDKILLCCRIPRQPSSGAEFECISSPFLRFRMQSAIVDVDQRMGRHYVGDRTFDQ